MGGDAVTFQSGFVVGQDGAGERDLLLFRCYGKIRTDASLEGFDGHVFGDLQADQSAPVVGDRYSEGHFVNVLVC